MTQDEASLLDRRLVIVVGKGGVGKTTVACALALEAVRRGKRVLLCEVDGMAQASRLLGVPPAPAGRASEALPGLYVMPVDGGAALAEYLQIIIPAKRLLKAVFKSRVYRYFVAAAPGLKELMTMGKLFYEAEREGEGGTRAWDVLIMDAPATGHSLQYLRMPMAARDAFGAGLVKRDAQRVIDLLTDPRRTVVHLVTTAEEMPVNETLHMFRQLRGDLGMTTGALFVNRMHRDRFSAAEVKRLLRAAEEETDDRERAALREVAGRAAEEGGWTRLNTRYRNRLARDVDLPIIEIPYLFSEEFGLPQVEEVAARIDGETRSG